MFGFGLWLLNDVVPNEDAIFVSQMEAGNLLFIWANVSWSNAHAAIIPYAIPYAFKNPVLATRFLALLCAWTSGISVFYLVRMAAGFPRRDALWTATLFVLWPGYMVQFAPSLVSYPFYLAVFLVGIALLFQAEVVCRLANAKRVLGGVLVFLSFTVNSLLVLFYAMMIVHHAMLVRLGRSGYGYHHLRRYVIRYWYLLLLPMAFWLIKQTYSSFIEVRPGYNAFVFDGATMTLSALTFAKAIWHATVPDDAFERSAMFFGALAGILVFAIRREPTRLVARRHSFPSQLIVIAIGFVLLLAAIAPYVLVGKAPGPSGTVDDSNWYTRHLLLTGIPVSLLIVATTGALERALPPAFGRFAVSIILGGLVSCYGFDRIRHCVRYQLIGIQDRALSERLKGDVLAKRTYVYGIASAVPGFSYAYKPDYTWPFFMERVFHGGIDRYVFEEESGRSDDYYSSRPFSEQFVMGYADLWHKSDRSRPWYSRPPSLTRQLSIVVETGISQSRTPFRDVIRYWTMRATDSDRLPAFLSTALNARLIEKRREARR